MTSPTGPLAGVRVVELAGIGPGPFAAMLLADLGADVVRIDRAVPGGLQLGLGDRQDVVNRGKRSLAVDLKNPEALALVKSLIAESDVVMEGFRPGVAERLGLGPDDCSALNPRIVYGRMTGWGQDGPLAMVAGHDIDYIALTGALWAIGRKDEAPTAPLNLLGDYAGGSMFLVVGILAALLEAKTSGKGQVVDAAMIDGTAVLTTMFAALSGMGAWDPTSRGTNVLDSGAPFYDTFECADGKWIAVGPIEPQFYAEMVTVSGFREGQDDSRLLQAPSAEWDASKAEWAVHWKTKTRDEWADLLGSTDACVQPVLTWAEAAEHPHVVARQTIVNIEGINQAAPAPRLSRTPLGIHRLPPIRGEHTEEVATGLGLTEEQVKALLASGAISAG